MIKKLLLLILLIFSTPAWATDYYVKTGGNDGNTGLNDGQAFASLYQAYNTASATDTIYLNKGDTWTVTVNRTSSEEAGVGLWLKLDSLTVDAYGTGADPIITAEAQTDVDDSRAQHYYSPIEVGIRYGYGPDDITIKNLDLRGPTNGSAIHAYSTGSGLAVQDCNVRGAGWTDNALIIAGNGDDNITISGNSFDAVQGAVEYGESFEIRGGSGHSITGNTFYGYGAGGGARFSGGGTGATIEKNFFYAPDTRAVAAYAIVVRDCAGGDYIIRNNVIDMTNHGAFSSTTDLRAMAFWGDTVATNRYVYNNTAVSDDTDGAFIDGAVGMGSTINVFNNIVIGVLTVFNDDDSDTHLRENIYHACTNFTENGNEGTNSNNVTTDPLIVDESMAGVTAADANITASSAASIDLGYGEAGASYMPSDDYAGTLRDVDLDIGAYEIPPQTAAVTGTAIAGGVTEAEIVTGGETIIITLTGDTWVATIGDDNQFTTDLIAGFDSGGAETAGWDAQVKGNMVFGDVTRTSDTVVTITLAAETSYAVTTNETITVTIPANALTQAAEVTASPTFEITASNPTAVITDTLSDGATETQIVNGGVNVTATITLTDDTWRASMCDNSATTNAFFQAWVSDGAEAGGWDLKVADILVDAVAAAACTRDSATAVTVVIPATADFDISANETVTLTIPAADLVTLASPLAATPTMTITHTASGGTETITGMTFQ